MINDFNFCCKTYLFCRQMCNSFVYDNIGSVTSLKAKKLKSWGDLSFFWELCLLGFTYMFLVFLG